MTISPTPSTDEMDDLEALEQQAAAAAAALERQKAALARARKAKEEAAAAEKKRQEEAAAAEKKAQEEAAAAEKKAEAEAAAAAKKAAAEAAAAEKKAAADAKKAARAASQSASPTRPEYADVKVEMTPVAEDDMPMPAKLTHVLAIVVSAVIVLCVSAVLADGTSVIKLKDPMHLKVATNPALKSLGFNHRLDELLGPTYGVGLHHDQAGYSWTDVKAGSTLRELIQNLGLPVIAAALPSVIATDALKHPVTLLSCDGLKAACLSAMVLGFVALSAAVVMVAFHAAALAGLIPSAKAKPFAALVWSVPTTRLLTVPCPLPPSLGLTLPIIPCRFVLTAGFLTVVLLAVGIYTSTWTCKNEIIPELKLSEHFECAPPPRPRDTPPPSPRPPRLGPSRPRRPRPCQPSLARPVLLSPVPTPFPSPAPRVQVQLRLLLCNGRLPLVAAHAARRRLVHLDAGRHRGQRQEGRGQGRRRRRGRPLLLRRHGARQSRTRPGHRTRRRSTAHVSARSALSAPLRPPNLRVCVRVRGRCSSCSRSPGRTTWTAPSPPTPTSTRARGRSRTTPAPTTTISTTWRASRRRSRRRSSKPAPT